MAMSTQHGGESVTQSGGSQVNVRHLCERLVVSPGISNRQNLQMKEDVLTLLAAGTHLSGINLDYQMERHVYRRKSDGIYSINLKRTWGSFC